VCETLLSTCITLLIDCCCSRSYRQLNMYSAYPSPLALYAAQQNTNMPQLPNGPLPLANARPMATIHTQNNYIHTDLRSIVRSHHRCQRSTLASRVSPTRVGAYAPCCPDLGFLAYASIFIAVAWPILQVQVIAISTTNSSRCGPSRSLQFPSPSAKCGSKQRAGGSTFIIA
jgi:hypothetical protein